MSLQNCRECGEMVSTEAGACPECGVPDPTGSSLPASGCLGCGREIAVPPGASCPHCGVSDPLTRFRPRSEPEAIDDGANKRLGLIGSAFLAIGVFLPIITVPFAGGRNFFQNGQGDGTIVLGVAIVAAVLAVGGKVRWLWLPGGASLVVVLLAFVRMLGAISEMESAMSRELAGTPFAGIGDIAMQGVQFQWGWAVLALGGLMVLAAGARQFATER